MASRTAVDTNETSSETVTEPKEAESNEPSTTTSPTLKLKLKKPKTEKKVVWTEGTVDNEGLGRKKSKCCCVYVKPKAFGESSSDESDGDCEHCSGHGFEKKTK